MNSKITLLAFSVVVLACTSQNDPAKKPAIVLPDKEEEASAAPASASPYQFSSPEKVFTMPITLREISGLEVMDNDHLACVQDEDGSIYVYSVTEEKVTKKIPFAARGDYEELAIVGKDAYVLESSGTIYHVKNFGAGDKPEVKKIETQLTKGSDAEGMCYDKANNRLLISLKGKAEKQEDKKKDIYAFELATQKLSDSPVLMLSLKDLQKGMSSAAGNSEDKSLKKAKKEDEVDKVFTPSGMAIHPVTGEIYVLSTQNNLVAILDPSGKVKEVHTLENKLFIQPEGITFSDEGDLYISNEGQKGLGNILKFTYGKK